MGSLAQDLTAPMPQICMTDGDKNTANSSTIQNATSRQGCPTKIISNKEIWYRQQMT